MDQQYHSRRRRRIVPSLPNDIVHDIILLLPATILLKFKCICKSWLSAITDPRFIVSHTDRVVNSPSTLLLFRTKYRNFRLYDYRSGTRKTLLLSDVFPDSKHYHPEDVPRNDIIPSVNGLLLLHSTRINHVAKPYTRVYICNPCTRETVTLPVLDVDLDNVIHIHGIDAIFPLRKPEFVYRSRSERFWFGVDPSSGKYKVVQFMDKISTRPSLCHIFTQGGDCWREVAHCPPFVRLTKFPVALKGVLYGMTDIDDYSDGAILSFDLVEERLTVFPSPPGLKEVEIGTPLGRVLKTTVVIQGRLSVVDCPADKPIIDVWMLNGEPNNSNNNIKGSGGEGSVGMYEWSKVYSFEIPIPQLERHIDRIRRVTMTYDGNFLLTTFEASLHSFDPNTRSVMGLTTKKGRAYRQRTSFLHGALDIDVLAFGTPYTETMAPAG